MKLHTESFQWRYFKNRKDESQRDNLPKSRYSKIFTNFDDAKAYWESKKEYWMQGELTQSGKIIIEVNTNQQFIKL